MLLSLCMEFEATPTLTLAPKRTRMPKSNKKTKADTKKTGSGKNLSLSGIDNRVGRALRWRMNAYKIDPTIANLIRPVPGMAKTKEPAPDQNPKQDTKSASKPLSQYRFKWGHSYFDAPVRENVVFYESFSGNGTLCNPFAVFKSLLHDPMRQNLEHVWSIRNDNERKAFNTEYAHYGNVRAVRHESADYWNELCTAKYLFNNATFPAYFTKRPEQIYVNTWHGTPLKAMGYHANEGSIGARNIIRNFVQADYLVSPNRFTTETMYQQAYRMQGIFSGKIIEQGYPRIDAQFSSKDEQRETLIALSDSGVQLSGRPIVLYAPTWKGESFHRPLNEAKSLLNRVQILKNSIGDKFDILLKVHQQVISHTKDIPELEPFLVPNSIPTNDALAVTDILITDYSSIFFDFLASDKPLIFFTPDKSDYSSLRGLYLDSLPGPDFSEIEDLAEALEQYGSNSNEDIISKFVSKRQLAQQTYCDREDGNSTSRIVNIVFDKNSSNLEVVETDSDSKEKILIYLGGMRRNGITASGLNLLTNIDYSKYDVSIWAPQPSKDNPADLYSKIPSDVRQFLRQGTHPLTEKRFKSMSRFLSLEEFDGATVPEDVKEVFNAEWRRSFGDSKFDYIVDFSGYAGFWSFVLLQGQARKSASVWQHSDLLSDRNKVVDGKKPNMGPLSSQFIAYRFFDNVVSVSEELMIINKSNLQKYTHKNAFGFCRNTLDTLRLSAALEASEELFDFTDSSRPLTIEMVLSKLVSHKGEQEILSMIANLKLKDRIFSKKGVVRFVTAGRLSPEKNQARMIRAFAKVHEQFPHTQLVIMGDGPVRNELEGLVHSLNLTDAVIFTGMVSNPLEIMRDCDCFVLSSDYEGQPMVILEASAMKIPVVTVNFDSVASALDETRGVIVDQDDDSLASGMIQYIEGSIIKSVDFDYFDYNREVMSEFYSAIGAK